MGSKDMVLTLQSFTLGRRKPPLRVWSFLHAGRVTKLRILAAEKVRAMDVKDVATRILSYIAGLDIFLAVKACIFPWADKSKL